MKKQIYFLFVLLSLLLVLIFKLNQSTRNNILPKKFRIYNVTYLGDQNRTSFTTVMTVLFLFGKSKHSGDEYEKWSSNMIDSFGATPVIAFVDNNWAQKFIDKFKQNNINGRIYIAHSIWDILGVHEKIRSREYTRVYKEKQLDIDPEKERHSPELYAVWNLKFYLMKKIVELNPYKSEFFIFTDGGAWRGKKFTNWPNEEFVRQLATKLDDRILFGQLDSFDPNHFDYIKDIIQATFFAGSAKAISLLYDKYFELHDEWFDQGLFVGKEQNQMNVLAFQRANVSIVRLRTYDLSCNSSYDKWFFYQYYFAQPSEYICSNDRFSILLT